MQNTPEPLPHRWQIELSGPSQCDLLVKVNAPPAAPDSELLPLAAAEVTRKTKIFAKNQIPLNEPSQDPPQRIGIPPPARSRRRRTAPNLTPTRSGSKGPAGSSERRAHRLTLNLDRNRPGGFQNGGRRRLERDRHAKNRPQPIGVFCCNEAAVTKLFTSFNDFGVSGS
jgi:hypothetical protein